MSSAAVMRLGYWTALTWDAKGCSKVRPSPYSASQPCRTVTAPDPILQYRAKTGARAEARCRAKWDAGSGKTHWEGLSQKEGTQRENNTNVRVEKETTKGILYSEKNVYVITTKEHRIRKKDFRSAIKQERKSGTQSA